MVLLAAAPLANAARCSANFRPSNLFHVRIDFTNECHFCRNKCSKFNAGGTRTPNPIYSFCLFATA